MKTKIKKTWILVLAALMISIVTEGIIWFSEPKVLDLASLEAHAENLYPEVANYTNGYDIFDATYVPNNEDPQIGFLMPEREIQSLVVEFQEPLKESVFISVYYAEDGGYLEEKNHSGASIEAGSDRAVVTLPLGEYTHIRVDIDGEFSLARIYTSNMPALKKQPIRAARIALIWLTLVCIVGIVSWRYEKLKSNIKPHYLRFVTKIEQKCDALANRDPVSLFAPTLSRKYAFLAALCFTILLLIGSICYGAVWETNDDPGILWLLSRDRYGYSPFQGKILCTLLHGLYRVAGTVNWWLITSYVCIGVGLCAILYVLLQRYPRVQGLILATAVSILVWRAALYAMNFTRTALIISAGGIILIADAVFPAKKMRRPQFWIQIVLGCLFLLIGAEVRRQCAYLALAFLAVIGAVEILSDPGWFRKAWQQAHWAQMVILICVALLLPARSYLNTVLLSDRERDYLEYNSVRSEIHDYPFECPEETILKETDLLEGDMDAFQSWFTEDTDVYDLDTLKKAVASNENTDSGNPVQSLIEAIWDSTLFLTVFAVSVVLIKTNGRSKWNRRTILSMVFSFFALLVVFLYLSWIGRPRARVLEPCIAIAVAANLFLAGISDKAEKDCQARRVKSLTCGVLTILTLLMLSGVTASLQTTTEQEAYIRERPWDPTVSYTEEQEAIVNWIQGTPNNVYIFTYGYYPVDSCSMLYGIWGVAPPDFFHNVFYAGGWETRLPYNVDRLMDYGITNPVKALVEKDNVYTTYCPMSLSFVQRHYNERTTQTGVINVGDAELIQYTLPVDDDEVATSGDGTYRLWEFSYDQMEETSWIFAGEMNDFDESYVSFYCNLTVDDVRYTYRICPDENGMFESYFYGIPESFDPETADLLVFAKNAEGIYTEISSCP